MFRIWCFNILKWSERFKATSVVLNLSLEENLFSIICFCSSIPLSLTPHLGTFKSTCFHKILLHNIQGLHLYLILFLITEIPCTYKIAFYTISMGFHCTSAFDAVAFLINVLNVVISVTYFSNFLIFWEVWIFKSPESFLFVTYFWEMEAVW